LRQPERPQKVHDLRSGGRRPLERPRRVGRRMRDVHGQYVRDVRTLALYDTSTDGCEPHNDEWRNPNDESNGKSE
jgi:hypothetical protein